MERGAILGWRNAVNHGLFLQNKDFSSGLDSKEANADKWLKNVHEKVGLKKRSKEVGEVICFLEVRRNAGLT